MPPTDPHSTGTNTTDSSAAYSNVIEPKPSSSAGGASGRVELAGVAGMHAAPETPRADVQRRALLGGVAGLAGLAVASRLAKGGQIQPPPGPVGPTGKTLSEVEPRIAIPRPTDSIPIYLENGGSYYLTRDIQVPDNRPGIVVTGSAVTLDLNGFSVAGPRRWWGSSGGGGPGISSAAHQFTLRNGSVKGFGGVGVSVPSGEAMVEDLTVVENGDGGMVFGGSAHAQNVIVRGNGGPGVAASYFCATGVQCTQNDGPGIDASVGTLRDCVTSVNYGPGFLLTSVVAENCLAFNNFGGGFRATGSSLTGCGSKLNFGFGFQLTSACSLMDCFAERTRGSDGRGFVALASGNHLERNRASGNEIGFELANSTGSNSLVRNTALHNVHRFSQQQQNYIIANPNQAIGPIVSGNSLATNSNPHSNISA